MSEHTTAGSAILGPFEVKEYNDGDIDICVEGWFTVATMNQKAGLSRNDILAIAHRLASAPKLLEALERLLTGDPNDYGDSGAEHGYCVFCKEHTCCEEPHAANCPWVLAQTAISEAKGEA